MCLAHVSLVTQECNIFSWNFLVMNLMSMSIIMSDCDVIGHIERARLILQVHFLLTDEAARHVLGRPELRRQVRFRLPTFFLESLIIHSGLEGSGNWKYLQI